MPDSKPTDQGELVEVFSTQQESEALVVQGLLESAGIQSLISADVGPQDVLPVGGVLVRVAPEYADSARRVIAESRTITDAEMAHEDSAQQLGTSGPSQ